MDHGWLALPLAVGAGRAGSAWRVWGPIAAVTIVVSLGIPADARGEDFREHRVAIDPHCNCSGTVDPLVDAAFLQNSPSGELSNAIARLVIGDANLASDVVCRAKAVTAEAAYAAGLGLALAGLNATSAETAVCCGSDELLASYYDTAYSQTSAAAPQCFAHVAGARAAQLLSPNFSGLGNASGFGGAPGPGSGSAGIIVTPAGP